jgi:hypothetical protein
VTVALDCCFELHDPQLPARSHSTAGRKAPDGFASSTGADSSNSS